MLAALRWEYSPETRAELVKKRLVIYGKGGLPDGRYAFPSAAKHVGLHARKFLYDAICVVEIPNYATGQAEKFCRLIKMAQICTGV